MRVQQRALKKTGKDSGIRAFISVSTWEISTLYRVPLCLCLLSSLSASLSRRKACTQRPASFEDGLSDFASSLYRAGRGEGMKQKEKKKKKGSPDREGHYYIVGT